MSPAELAVQAAVGLGSALLAIYADKRLTAWRLKGLESRMGKAEGKISQLEKQTAGIEARIS